MKTTTQEKTPAFLALEERLGQQDPAEWHQHPNGGGWIHKSATVDDSSYIGEKAIVFGDARVSGNARVYGNAWKVSPLYIQGSKYCLTNAKAGHVQIGCKCETFDWWLGKEGTEFAKENSFTDADIEEYRAYVELRQRFARGHAGRKPKSLRK